MQAMAARLARKIGVKAATRCRSISCSGAGPCTDAQFTQTGLSLRRRTEVLRKSERLSSKASKNTRQSPVKRTSYSITQ